VYATGSDAWDAIAEIEDLFVNNFYED
jgi:phosphotransferase system HPr-like phosphotransfer protein